MSDGFDIASLDLQKGAEAGAECELVHPITGEPLGVVLHLLGTESKAYRAAQRAVINSAVKAGKRRSDDEGETRVIGLLAAVTTGWKGLLWEGKDLPFSKDNAVMVYTERPWVFAQAFAFVGDNTNFFKG